MKIDKSTPPLPATQIGEFSPRSSNAKSAGIPTPSDTRVHLGTGNAQLRSLESSIANTSVIDKEKVAAIKQAISEGRFQINNSQVADRLIDSVKELIDTNKG